MTDDQDLSPTLGGSRAQGEPEPAAPADEASDGPAGASPFEASGQFEGSAEFEGLFGAESAEVLQAIAQLGAVGEEISGLVAETVERLESQLPAAFEAVEGLFGALGQAFEQALDSLSRDGED